MFLQSNLPWLVPANPERRTDRLQGSGTQAVGHVLSAAIMFFSATLLMKLLVQEFSSDLGCRTVKRIADVSKLRIYQFPQVFLICALSLHSNLLPNEINCSNMVFWPPCDFFPDIQDAGPMAHPIRPHSYIKVPMLTLFSHLNLLLCCLQPA